MHWLEASTSPESLLASAATPAMTAMMVLAPLIWITALSAREGYTPRVMASTADQAMRVFGAVLPAWVFTQLLAFLVKATSVTAQARDFLSSLTLAENRIVPRFSSRRLALELARISRRRSPISSRSSRNFSSAFSSAERPRISVTKLSNVAGMGSV